MMCQCMFAFGEKSAILVSDVDKGGTCVCMCGGRVFYEIPVPPSQFCGKPETALKSSLIKKKKKQPTCKYQSEGVKPTSFTRKLKGHERK